MLTVYIMLISKNVHFSFLFSFVPVLSQTTNVCVSGPPSEDEQVPKIHCQFKFTLYMQKNKDRSEGVEMGDTSEANGNGNAQQRKQEQLVTIFERF